MVPPRRTGLIAGIVVAGFRLAPVVLAPLTKWFLDLFATTNAEGVVEQGVPGTMIALGVVTWVVIAALVLFVRNPPEGRLVQPPPGARPHHRLSRQRQGAGRDLRGGRGRAGHVAHVDNGVGVGAHWQW